MHSMPWPNCACTLADIFCKQHIAPLFAVTLCIRTYTKCLCRTQHLDMHLSALELSTRAQQTSAAARSAEAGFSGRSRSHAPPQYSARLSCRAASLTSQTIQAESVGQVVASPLRPSVLAARASTEAIHSVLGPCRGLMTYPSWTECPSCQKPCPTCRDFAARLL